jgi:uncharacterized membrane protein
MINNNQHNNFRNLNKNTTHSYYLIFLIIVLLSLGIFFRFANLEDKVFWVDEVATITRVAGYTKSEMINDLLSKQIVDVDTLLGYQRLTEVKSFIDTWNTLLKSPEHAPLYFLVTRLWIQFKGDSITNLRSLSIIFSLFIFPSLYWLGQELFKNKTVPWIAVILMSVSPFFVTYAQEARPYSLWTVTILIMSASLLRAIRVNSWQAWAGYIISSVLGFYTSLLSLLIAIAQGIYLFLLNKQLKPKVIKNYLLSLSISLIFFAPWLLVITHNLQPLQDNTTWMRGNNLDIATVIAVWIGSILLIFGDLPVDPNTNPIQIAVILAGSIILLAGSFLLASGWSNFKKRSQTLTCYFSIFIISLIAASLLLAKESLSIYTYLNPVAIIGIIVALLILILATYSLYFLIANSPQTKWLFIISLILSILVPLFILDLINQGQSSATPRYLIPLQIGIQLAVAYTLANHLESNNFLSVKTKTVWKAIALTILTVGIVSCILNLHKSPIYQKNRNIHNIAIAKTINRAHSPLILSEPGDIMDSLSLSHYLAPQVKFKLISSSENWLAYAEDFSDTFLFKPSAELKQKLQKNPKIKLQLAYQPELFSSSDIFIELFAIIENNI